MFGRRSIILWHAPALVPSLISRNFMNLEILEYYKNPYFFNGFAYILSLCESEGQSVGDSSQITPVLGRHDCTRVCM